MANLNLNRAKAAVLSMDIQRGTVRRSSMFHERNVGQAARSVLESARKGGILVVHVVIDYQPAFFSPRNKFLQKIRIPVLSAPGVDVAELLEVVDEVKPVGDEPVIRKPLSYWTERFSSEMMRNRGPQDFMSWYTAWRLARAQQR